MKQIKYFLIVTTIVLSFQSIIAQIHPSYVQDYYSKFSVTHSSSPGLDGKVDLKIYVHIPYSNLVFEKANENYKSKFLISAGAYHKKKQMAANSKKAGFVLDNYGDTKSSSKTYVDSLTISALAGTYTLILNIKDRNSNKEMPFKEYKVKFPDFNDGWEISEPVFLKDGKISKATASTNDTLIFRLNVYVHPESTVFLDYELSKKKEKIFFPKDTLIAKINENQTNFTNSLSRLHTAKMLFPKISGGVYKLKISLSDSDNNVKSAKITELTVLTSYSDMTKDDFEKELFLLSIIGTNKEIDILEEEPDSTRDSLLAIFWKKRDFTPDTEENEFKDEFIRRVNYANTHFSDLRQGYRSAMGRVYILPH